MPTRLDAARDRLGYAIGLYLTSTTTGGSSATDTLTLGDLADSDAEANLYARCYAMPVSTASANAGQVRRIRAAGFAAATGVVRTTSVYSGLTSSAVKVVICAPLPPKDGDGRVGLHTLINRSLAESWDIDTLAITPVAGVSTYSLSTVAEWIRSDEQIVDVWFRRSGSTTDELVPEWRFNHDVDNAVLELRGGALSTADTLKPVVYRPLNTWIETAGTWGASTAGLVNDSDRCLLSEEGIEIIGKAHALHALSNMGDFEGRRVDLADAKNARQAADAWKHNNLPRKEGRPRHWTAARTVGQGPAWPREGSLG